MELRTRSASNVSKATIAQVQLALASLANKENTVHVGRRSNKNVRKDTSAQHGPSNYSVPQAHIAPVGK